VLSDRPSVIVKQVQDENNIIYRYANPIMHPNDNLVDVCYDVIVINKENSIASHINEVHKMRYFFKPEIEMMLENAGFILKACIDCNTLGEAGFESWTVYFIAEKR
jgi:hypothetical protein